MTRPGLICLALVLSMPGDGSGHEGVLRLVPIVLDVVSTRASYSTEVVLTNRGRSDATARLSYTASLGSGSGSVLEELPAGRQLVVSDVLSWLRDRGLAIPRGASGPQAGTLLVAFDGADSEEAVSVTARTLSPTAAPLPAGSVSLSYPGLAPSELGADAVTVFGLRSGSADRSKLAVVNAEDTEVTLRVTVVAGDGGRATVVREALTLPPYGWRQLEDPLGEAAVDNGWAVVERVSPSGSFTAYGVVNDSVTNDGSFVEGVRGVPAGRSLVVPVLVESGRFRSELVVANRGAAAASLTLRYRESLSPSRGIGGQVSLTVAAGNQLVFPEAIELLRKGGLALGSAGEADRAGALRVEVSGVPLSDVFVGARTAAPAMGGQLGLFAPPVYEGQEAGPAAVVDGLQTSASVRSNVAVVHAGGDGEGPVTLRLQAYDGETGAARGDALDLTLSPGEWSQPAGFFGSSGAAHGWVVLRRLSGTAPWLAYGVVNDGGAPGQGTDDGAYVSMRRIP